MDLHPSPSAQPSAPAPRRRRRWWVYVLWTFGVLFALVILLLISGAIYWNHFIKTYTSAEPAILPKVEVTDEQFDEVKGRWEAYSLLYLKQGERPPLELTDQELNLLLSRIGPMRRRAYVESRDNGVWVKFAAPFGGGGSRGRFLNGEGLVKLELDKGRVSARLVELKANGKVLPGWLFRRLQGVNWLDRMNWRPETDLVVRGLDRIETQPGIVVLHPRPASASPR